MDDDESVRESFLICAGGSGFATHTFSTPEEFLSSDSLIPNQMSHSRPSPCLRMTGFNLQRELKLRGRSIPIIFITAHRDEVFRSRALDQGAVELCLSLFSDMALLQALNMHSSR